MHTSSCQWFIREVAFDAVPCLSNWATQVSVDSQGIHGIEKGVDQVRKYNEDEVELHDLFPFQVEVELGKWMQQEFIDVLGIANHLIEHFDFTSSICVAHLRWR